jgi:D-alanine transaminase
MTDERYVDLAELAGGFIHDIKNHISTLSVQLQLLEEDFQGPQSPRERRAQDRVQRLRGECQRLVDISNDFLRFARVQELDRRPTHLPELVEELVDFFTPVAQQAGIDIKAYLPADLPVIELDRELFTQALVNLLWNAKEAMPDGGTITLQAAAEPDAVRLEIIDTGRGMSADVVARIFKPFYSTKPKGTGLGLATTRKVILTHGGSIDVQSEVGVGTRFTVRLPRAPGNGRPATVPLADLNGRTMPLTDVKISALDRGFLFGDGVYEVLRVYGGKPWLEEEHFQRLERSLREVRLEGINLPALRRRMLDLLRTSGQADATIYIEITRGAALPRTHAFPKHATPTELIWVSPYDDTSTAKGRREGVSVLLQPDQRWGRCDIKSVNLLSNVLVNQAAKEAGCAEAILYTPDGLLTEASHSSFFAIKDGVLISTPLSPAVLPSITREFVLRLAKELALPVEERSLHRSELTEIQEMFLVGTTSEVLPVVRVDDLTIGTGQPGPISRRLQEAHERAVATFLGQDGDQRPTSTQTISSSVRA